MYILTFVPLQMQWKKSVWISSHRAKEIVIMTGPMQQELYYFSWFTATFSVCIANLFEMEYLFIKNKVEKMYSFSLLGYICFLCLMMD